MLPFIELDDELTEFCVAHESMGATSSHYVLLMTLRLLLVDRPAHPIAIGHCLAGCCRAYRSAYRSVRMMRLSYTCPNEVV